MPQSQAERVQHLAASLLRVRPSVKRAGAKRLRKSA